MGDNLKGAGAADALRADHGYDTNRASDGTVYLIRKNQPDYKAAQDDGLDKTTAGIAATSDAIIRDWKSSLIKDRKK